MHISGGRAEEEPKITELERTIAIKNIPISFYHPERQLGELMKGKEKEVREALSNLEKLGVFSLNTNYKFPMKFPYIFGNRCAYVPVQTKIKALAE